MHGQLDGVHCHGGARWCAAATSTKKGPCQDLGRPATTNDVFECGAKRECSTNGTVPLVRTTSLAVSFEKCLRPTFFP